MSKNRELADLAGKDLATQAELDAAVASSTEINDGTVSPTDTWSSQKIDGLFDTKQDILVSGTNIKTVNGTSVLGSGDFEITNGVIGNFVEQWVYGGMVSSSRTIPIPTGAKTCMAYLFGKGGNGYRTSSTAGNSGGGGVGIPGSGADGAVRIIYPGTKRQFPSTRTADE